MKRKASKFLSILLTLVMVIGMLPAASLTAHAATIIDTVELTMPYKIGQTLSPNSITWLNWKGEMESFSLKVNESEVPSAGVELKNGDRIHLSCTMQPTSDTAYSLGTTATVNGRSASVWYIEYSGNITISYDYTVSKVTDLRWDGNVARWNAVEGADEISVYLKCSEDPDRSLNNFLNAYRVNLPGTATEYDWSDYLNPGVTYAFAVDAYYGETRVQGGYTEKKTVAGSIGTFDVNWADSTPVVTWEPVDGAVYYNCQVINSGGQQVGTWIEVTEGTSLDLTELVDFHGSDEYSVNVWASSTPYSYVNWLAYGYAEPHLLKGSPYASIEEDEISGTLNQQVYGQSITITLTSDTFKPSLSGDWITNLPAGLSQHVTRISDTQAQITITGIPTSQSHDYVEVTIPANMLNGGAEVVVKPNSIYSVAKFNITSYFTVTYKDGANGDFFPYRLYICEYGDPTPKFPYTPWQTGYAFKGWSPSVADTVTANAVYTATWEAKDYTVTFYLADIPSVTVKYGQKYTLPEPADDPDDNKVFKGWQRGGQVLQPGDTITIDGYMCFYAQWETDATQYTVVFTDGTDDEKVFESYSAANDAGDFVYACNKNSDTPNPFVSSPGGVPSRAGYTFKCWSPSLSDTVTQNVVYTAQWEPNTYTISYTSGGFGIGMDPVDVGFGSQYTFPVCTGKLQNKKIFEYWTIGSGTEKYYPGQTITIDETVIPNTGSSINVKAVTVDGKFLYISNGTANGKTGDLLFAPGEKIEIVATPEPGYKFQEWNVKDYFYGDSVKVSGFDTSASSTLLVMPEQDIAIEAVEEKLDGPVAPVASVPSGTNFATDDMAVAITCEDDEADIYVALFGDDPRLETSEYRWKWTNGKTIYMGRDYDEELNYENYTLAGKDVSLKVASVKDGVWSDVVTYTYHKIGSGEVTAPTATPGNCTFENGDSIKVSLKSDIKGVEIKYSRDGGATSYTYTKPITISSTTELTVWAVTVYSTGKNYLSDKTTYTYTEKTLGGVTVSGSAVSWNNTDDAVYLLYGSTVDDATIKAEWKNGTYATAGNVVYTATKGSITDATVDGKTMKAQTFSFADVASGTYKLVILKPGKYVPKIVEITVGSSAVDAGQQKLWLYGDVTYDGAVDTNDVIQMNRYINTKGSLITTGTAEEIAEKKTVCDINCDDTIDTNDVIQMNRYINTKGSLFNNFK